MMKHLITLLLSMMALQGCSVYGDLTKCEGFDEAGTSCTGLISNLEYSKQREQGIVPSTASDLAQIDYELLDAQVRNDEFARLMLDKKVSMAETDPVLRPAKTVKATIYPYSDGSKFYQLRHIWIKIEPEEWIVGDKMLVDAKGTVMMSQGATVNSKGENYDTKNAARSSKVNGGERTAGRGGNDSFNSNNAATGEQGWNIEQESTVNQESTKDGVSIKIIDDYSSKYKAGDIVTINVIYLNVRQEPNADSTIIGVIPAGGKLRILNETEGYWQRVRAVYYPRNELTKEYDGWVHTGYLMSTNPEAETWEDAL